MIHVGVILGKVVAVRTEMPFLLDEGDNLPCGVCVGFSLHDVPHVPHNTSIHVHSENCLEHCHSHSNDSSLFNSHF